MRRYICAITALVLLICSCFSAFAESKYVSITDIRSTIPERWTGEYTTKKGETVSIDTPIVVPEVDAVPVVRITWGGPVEQYSESLQGVDNSRNSLFSITTGLTICLMIRSLKKAVPLI